MQKLKNTWIIHLLAGICFLLIPVILAPQPPGVSRFQLDPPSLRDVLGNLLILGFFYLNFYYLIPKLLLRKRYLPYALWVLACLTVVILIPKIGFPNLEMPPEMRPSGKHPEPDFGPGPGPGGPRGPKPGLFGGMRHTPFWAYLVTVNSQVLLFAVVVLFSILLRLRETLFQTEQAGNKAEINALKAQINPHFLFNTLNSIYALSIREHADKTGESVLKLSQMMRYVVSDSEKELVSLSKEIEYLESYLELQKLRLPKDFIILVDKQGEINGKMIAPLLLIPFLENAFKHGVSPEEPGEIRVRIQADEEKLNFQVWNKISTHPLQTHEQSGLGIENTENRLRLIYGSDYQLEFGEKNGYFEVNLQIPF